MSAERYRVTFETERLDRKARAGRMILGEFEGLPVTLSLDGIDSRKILSVERLPDPEPEWLPGDVVLDALGHTFVRNGHDQGWPWTQARVTLSVIADDKHLYAARWAEEGPTRPLTLLVRNGERVTP